MMNVHHSPVIEIHNLSKEYRLGSWQRFKVRALNKVSFSVPKGSIFGLIGPNGSGKSTLIKILLNLIASQRGSCKLFGQNCQEKILRQRIGYCPETPYFYKYLKGEELLEFYAKLSSLPTTERKSAIQKALEAVGLKEASKRKLHTYSKGMLQRIGLAQALLNDPELLILDEPFTGLDPLGMELVYKLIERSKAEGKTIFICSHLLTDLETLCDQIALLHKGELLLKGNLKNLLENFAKQQGKPASLRNLFNDACLQNSTNSL